MKDLAKKIVVFITVSLLIVCCAACASETNGGNKTDEPGGNSGVVNPDDNDGQEAEKTEYLITYDPIVSNAVIKGTEDALKSGLKQTVEYDKPYKLYEPQSAHNVFVRWYYVKDGAKVTLAAEGVYLLKEDVTIYAEWYDASADGNIAFPK